MSVEQRNNPKLLIGIIGALSAVAILVVVYQWLNHVPAATTEQEQTVITRPAAPPVAEPLQESAGRQNESAAPQVLVTEDMMNTAVPTTPALAKEEVAKLEDLQAQLNDQKATLEAQHNDADQLIQLKEEQIKLLEAQLAHSQ